MAEGIDYGKLLDALIEERGKIDMMISWAKGKLAEGNPGGSVTVDTLLRDRPEKSSEPMRHPRFKSDTFFKMSVMDAIEECLNIAKRPLPAKDITDALQSGGLTHKAKDLYQTVFPTLGRMKERGIVEKLPTGEWGLAAWYGRKSASSPQATEEEK
jgi:hypothetical protein